jgi:mannose-6-phosphate isomerase
MSAVRLKEKSYPKIWGSTQLEPWYPNSSEKIGEIWFTGEPLPPLLAKFLFTTEPLSVQVHPGGDTGKTEMWHILRVEPGASLAAGFREEISRERLLESAESGEIEKLLNWIPVQPGDTLFIPAGTVHAIGAGLAICEIQQYSDVTYRLYDYGRPRELHLEQGAPISHLGMHPGVIRTADERLVSCEYFQTDLLRIDGSRNLNGDILVILKGEGLVDGQSCRLGQAWRLDGTVHVEGKLEALLARVPR